MSCLSIPTAAEEKNTKQWFPLQVSSKPLAPAQLNIT